MFCGREAHFVHVYSSLQLITTNSHTVWGVSIQVDAFTTEQLSPHFILLQLMSCGYVFQVHPHTSLSKSGQRQLDSVTTVVVLVAYY
jgi:hypothetical protein